MDSSSYAKRTALVVGKNHLRYACILCVISIVVLISCVALVLLILHQTLTERT